MLQNVVIGNPICEPWQLLASTLEDWKTNEQKNTLFTNERFLPKLMVECGLVKSINEIRRNKPELIKTLNNIDFHEIKWGKKRLFIVVGN